MSLSHRVDAFLAAALVIACTCTACHPSIALVEAPADVSRHYRSDEIHGRLAASTVFVEAEIDQPTTNGRITRSVRGTGAIVSGDGPLVLTANHIVGDASTVRIAFLNAEGDRTGGQMEMEVFRSSEARDVALLRPAGGRRSLTPIAIARRIPERDESVWFLGSTSSFTGGTVLDNEAILRPRGRTMQVEAASARGDSGAPCVNDRGELVGILIAGSAPTRRAHFIRIDDALAALGIRR